MMEIAIEDSSTKSKSLHTTTTPHDGAIYLNREQAAAYISQRVGVRITSTILANRASLGTGPSYRIWNGRGSGRGGRGRYAVYKPADLDLWIEANLHDPSSHE